MKTAQATIESCAAGRGHGVAHAEGMTLFVPGTVPGDVAEIQWEPPAGKRTWAIARAVRLVQPSPHRVEPFCPYACARPEAVGESCGGCPWMAIAREEQLRQKIAIARHAFRGFPLSEAIETRIPRSDRGLRCRARMNAIGGRLGFFAALSANVIDVDACPMLQQPSAHGFLRKFLPAGSAVEVRLLQGRDESLHVTLDVPLQAAFDKLRAAAPHLAGARIAGTDAGEAGIWVDTPEYGPLRLSSAGFFQAGPEVNALILGALEECLQAIGDAGPILEGYAGAGNCTRVVRRYGDTTAVESDPASCRFFHENMESHAHAGGAVHLLPETMEQAVSSMSPGKARTLVLDPPRAGVGPRVSAALVALAPENVVLISCDPASGARDARAWLDADYRLTQWILVDSMPHTPHMEIVQRFTRRSTP